MVKLVYVCFAVVWQCLSCFMAENVPISNSTVANIDYPKWVVSQAMIEINILKLPEHRHIEDGRATFSMTESFILDRIPGLINQSTFSLNKQVAEMEKHGRLFNIIVKSSNGTLTWKKDRTSINIIKIKITTSVLPLKIWLEYNLNNNWERVVFPGKVNPFPLYTYMLNDFASYWISKRYFDVALPKMSMKKNIIMDIDKVIFITRTKHERIQAVADIFHLNADNNNGGITAQYKLSCSRNATGKVQISYCPLAAQNEDSSDLIQLDLFYSPRMSPRLPDHCIRGFSVYANYSVNVHDPINYLAYLIYNAKPWFTYLTLFALGTLSALWGCHFVENNQDFESLETCIKWMFAPFIIFTTMLCVDTAYRINMGACHIFYDDFEYSMSVWYMELVMWLLYPAAIMILCLLPFHIFACVTYDLLELQRESSRTADDVCMATSPYDNSDLDFVNEDQCVLFDTKMNQHGQDNKKVLMESITCDMKSITSDNKIVSCDTKTVSRDTNINNNNTNSSNDIKSVNTQPENRTQEFNNTSCNIDWLADFLLTAMKCLIDLAILFAITLTVSAIASGLAPLWSLPLVVAVMGLIHMLALTWKGMIYPA